MAKQNIDVKIMSFYNIRMGKNLQKKSVSVESCRTPLSNQFFRSKAQLGGITHCFNPIIQ